MAAGSPQWSIGVPLKYLEFFVVPFDKQKQTKLDGSGKRKNVIM